MATSLNGDSPQVVAFRLLELIAFQERKDLDTMGTADRQYILDTYKECLDAVLGTDTRWGPQAPGA